MRKEAKKMKAGWTKSSEYYDARNFAQRAFPGVEKRDISEIEGKEVIIQAFDKREGKFGPYAIILCTEPGKTDEFVVTCGGKVVMRKLEYVLSIGWKDIHGRFARVESEQNPGRKYWDIVP